MRYSSRYILLILLSCLSLSLFAQETPVKDTTYTSMDKETVELIMKMFDGQDISLIKTKADQLISTGENPEEQAVIASHIFDYYQHSKYMGYEEIALYIADNYFLNGKLTWPEEDGYLMVKMFAEFNRQSMIGLMAPELLLTDTLGREVSIRKTDSRYKVIFFYDDECPTCNLYTPRIMRYLNKFKSGTLSLFRVYTQANRDNWCNYVKKIDARFPVSENVSIYDVWDPELVSDFQRKYGVVSTPQLLLLNRDNIIMGRKLDPSALSQLIEMDYNKPTELQSFLDQLFSSLLPYDESQDIDTTLIVSTIDDLYNKTKADTSVFQEVFYNSYQYLKGHQEYDMQKGAAYIGNKYIIKMPGMWKDANFSEKEDSEGKAPLGIEFPSSEAFIQETAEAVDQFYRNQLGKPVANLYLSLPDKSSYSIYDSKAKYTVLYFYNMDCALCEAVSGDMKDIYSEFSDKGVNVLAVYTGSFKKRKEWIKYIADNGYEWTNLIDKKDSQEMFEKYNLSGVPVIYLLDEEKNTLAKDITPGVLKEILNYLLYD